MASSTSNAVWYVYGIVPASFSPATLPLGLDDVPVSLERGDAVAALVSALPESQYEPPALEANSGDVDWLSPRAVAHDHVLTWASDLGPVVPLPMFSLFSGQSAVCAMLRDRTAELVSTLARLAEGREYALRVYRVDAEMMSSMGSLSPRLGELAATAAAASPGQRYLLERKLDAERKGEMRAVTQQLVDEIAASLDAASLRSVRVAVPRTDADGARGVMVLNGAFMVAPSSLERFQQTLTSLVERLGAHGLRFDFTGPWPPYHFASEADRGA
jgi:Gas vesicle synthesis protein GvpL/GvpF